MLFFMTLLYLSQKGAIFIFTYFDIKSLWLDVIAPLSHFYLFNQFIISIPIRAIFLILVLKYCFLFSNRELPEKPMISHYFSGVTLTFGIYFLSEVFYLATGGLSLSGFKEVGYVLQSLPFILLSSIMTSYAEELIFREVLLDSLDTITESFFIANIIQGIVFALAHLSNPGVSLTRFGSWVLMGIFLGLLKKESGSIWFSAGCHSGFHLLCLLTPFLSYTGIRDNGSIAFKIIVGLIALILTYKNELIKKHPIFYQLFEKSLVKNIKC